jgi:hypothetical protein
MAITSYHPDIEARAYELIRTGREKFGSFWNHRTSTASALGYGDWDMVPEDIRMCVNSIGRNARLRNNQRSHGPQRPSVPRTLPPPVRPVNVGFVVTNETLEDIWDYALPVPKTATMKQIRLIREYVTLRAGFNPETCLLGIASRMEV